jgi:hypothetical protein
LVVLFAPLWGWSILVKPAEHDVRRWKHKPHRTFSLPQSGHLKYCMADFFRSRTCSKKKTHIHTHTQMTEVSMCSNHLRQQKPFLPCVSWKVRRWRVAGRSLCCPAAGLQLMKCPFIHPGTGPRWSLAQTH